MCVNVDIKQVKDNASHAVRLLKILSNEKRLAIICSLCDSEKSVGKLEKFVGLSQSALSQHLAKLRKSGLVKTRREAQTIYYSLNDDHKGTHELLECLCRIFSARES